MSCQLCLKSLKRDDEEEDDEDQEQSTEQIQSIIAARYIKPFVTRKKKCDCEVHRSCWDDHVKRFDSKPNLIYICQIHNCSFCKEKNAEESFEGCSCTFHRKCWNKMFNGKLATSKEEISAVCSELETQLLPYCFIHDCALCRNSIRKSAKPSRILKCGCNIHDECMSIFSPIIGTQCPVCIFRMSDDDLKYWRSQTTILNAYLPTLTWTSNNRALLFNKKFIERRNKYDLMHIGVTLDDFLTAGFTFDDFLLKIINAKSEWTDASHFKVEARHITTDVYKFLLKQKTKGKDIPSILSEWGITFVSLKREKYSYKELSNTDHGIGYTMNHLVNQNFTKDDFFRFTVIEPEKFKEYLGLTKSFFIDHLQLKPADYKTLFSLHKWKFEDLVRVYGYNEKEDKDLVFGVANASISSGFGLTGIFSSFNFNTEPPQKQEQQPKLLKDVTTLKKLDSL